MVADSHLHSKSLSTTLSLNNNFLRVDSAILKDSQHSRSQVQWRYARANAGFHCLENNRSSDRLARAAKWRSAFTKEIKRGIAIAKYAVVPLSQIWKNKSISVKMKTKMRILKCLVFPIATKAIFCWSCN